MREQMTYKNSWCRCACGTHPFPFRTRWLRHRRPMVLCWRRHGRVGGCQLYGGIAQLGERLPCKQEVTSSNLVISTKAFLKAQTMDGTIHKLAWMYRGGALMAFSKCPWTRKSKIFECHESLEKALQYHVPWKLHIENDKTSNRKI